MKFNDLIIFTCKSENTRGSGICFFLLSLIPKPMYRRTSEKRYLTVRNIFLLKIILNQKNCSQLYLNGNDNKLVKIQFVTKGRFSNKVVFCEKKFSEWLISTKQFAGSTSNFQKLFWKMFMYNRLQVNRIL